MRGFPKLFKTKQDLLHGVEYCKSFPANKNRMKAVLEEIKEDTMISVLKEESKGKKAEEQTMDDYELVYDPNCRKVRMGITDEEINRLIGELN